jgi:hypothetical protein
MVFKKFYPSFRPVIFHIELILPQDSGFSNNWVLLGQDDGQYTF